MAKLDDLGAKINRRAKHAVVKTVGLRRAQALRDRGRSTREKLRWETEDAVAKTVGVRLHAQGLQARGHSASDRFVFNEIFGGEDAYRLATLVPLMRGGTVVEIGAHKGYFTVLAGSVAERVLVFEPDPTNYSYLVRNVALNSQTNVTALHQAVSATAGTRQLAIGHTDARNTFFPSTFSGNKRRVQVECTTLPQALRDHGVDRIDVLKLDCEGSEYDVLLNCDAETMSKVRVITLEMHESGEISHTTAEMVAFLESHGFTGEVYDEHQRGDLFTCMGFFSK